jgi:hypothetical protein
MPSTHRDSLTETQLHVGNLIDSAIHAKDRAKDKTKQILSSGNQGPNTDDEDDIFFDAAFDPASVLSQSSPRRRAGSGKSAKENLSSAAYLVAHPRRVMRSKATRIAAEKLGRRHPLLTLDHDQELLNAHDALSRAVSSNSSDTSDLENVSAELENAHSRVQKVEEQRESLQTAWILSRHVARVKAVRPLSPRDQSSFTNPDRFEWERYLAHMALYCTRSFTTGYIDDFKSAPFDLEDLARIIERIAITSAPWQAFLVKVRNVYMWRDPKVTARWLALYCVLWYTQHIVAYFYFYVIFSTLRNRFRERSVRTIRESVGRALDREARVQAWGELIQRHGQHDWLEPFLDEIGPIIQLQLGDLADMLEILTNFHRWERPNLTLATLFFYFCCLLVSLFADMEFCMKLIWLISGMAFFVAYPISANFPMYRLLLSPWRWAFWDIPTHSELAILTLQVKVASRESSLKEFEYRTDETMEKKQDTDRAAHHTFTAYTKAEGRCQLVVSRHHLGLSIKSQPLQTWQFSTLAEIRKLDDTDIHATSMIKNLKSLHSQSASALQFLFLEQDDLIVLLSPADRDRVFNLILAWSGLKWQCLQMERHSGLGSERSNLDRAIKRAFH